MTGILNCFNKSREDDKRCKQRVRNILFGDEDNNKRFPNRIKREDVAYLKIFEYIKNDPTKWFGFIGKPYLEAFNTVGSLFYLINTIAEGYPSVYAKVMESFLAYGSIPTALISATATTLSQSTYAFAGLPTAYVKAVNRTIMVTAANSQMTFEGVSDIIRHVQKLPPTAPVDTPSIVAWAVILLNFLVALIRGIQTYHIETHFGPPIVIASDNPLFRHEKPKPGCTSKALEFINKVAGSCLLTRVFTMIDVAGATNLFIGELAKLFFPNAGSIGVIARYSAAFFAGGIASALAGGTINDQKVTVRYEDNSEKIERKSVAKLVDLSAAVIRSMGVGIMIGSRLAGGLVGTAIIYEQLAFWFAAIILYNFLSQLAVHYAFNKLCEYEAAPDIESHSHSHSHSRSCFCCSCLPLFKGKSTRTETLSLLAPRAEGDNDDPASSSSEDNVGNNRTRRQFGIINK